MQTSYVAIMAMRIFESVMSILIMKKKLFAVSLG
jgi:hypothetical protein